MTNQQKKHDKWQQLLTKFKHLENYCTITAKGLDNDDIWFHPEFKINEDCYISSQSDVGNSYAPIYAFRFNFKIVNSYNSVEISDDLLTSIIIGYHSNKDVVMLAMSTLSNIRTHINQLQCYTDDYIRNVIIGNSIKETTQHFINELDATNKAIEVLQKINK